MGKKSAPKTCVVPLNKPIKLIVEDAEGGRAEVKGTVTFGEHVGSELVLIVRGQAQALSPAANIYPQH
jgi:hypothetical protein